jgi:hypothetical protein
MEKVKLTKVARFDVDKNKKPLVTKDGRPFERVRIQTTKHGDFWISGFGTPENKNWKIGDEVELLIETSGEYLNFKMPSKKTFVEDKMFDFEVRLKRLENIVEELADKVSETPIRENDFPEEESKDSPF